MHNALEYLYISQLQEALQVQICYNLLTCFKWELSGLYCSPTVPGLTRASNILLAIPY